MKIVIPTYRRCDRQKTLSAIPKKWLKRTVLVVDEQDYRTMLSLQIAEVIPKAKFCARLAKVLR